MAEDNKVPTRGAVVALPNEEFLNVRYIAKQILERLNPRLMFLQDDGVKLPRVKANARSVTWYEDSNSDSSDPLKKTARRRTSIAEFASVDITALVQKTAALEAYGFEVAFDEDVVLFEEKIDDVMRARNRVAHWLAIQRNSKHSEALAGKAFASGTDFVDDATDGPRVVTASTPWTASSPDPVKDVLSAREKLEDQSGYAYRLTDLFLNTPDYYNLVKFLVNKTSTLWQKDPFGQFQVPALAGITFHQIGTSEITLQSDLGRLALGVDRNNPPATLYQAFDPRFSVDDEIMAFNYMDPATHKLHYQFWYMEKAAVKEPLSVILIEDLS